MTDIQHLSRPDGETLAFKRVDGEGPTVVWIGGFRSDMEGTKAVALDGAARARGWNYVRYDHFAHGRSSGDWRRATIGRWREDAVALIDSLEGPVVPVGSSMGGWVALLATLAPGDEVIIPAPYWAPYLDQVRLSHGTPVVVPCAQNNGFKLRAEDLQAAISARTRWIVINNPVNPSGALYSREDLAEIAAVLSRHPEIWVLADGLYEHIAFDGAPATTLAEIEPRLKPRTLTVSGLAKSYAMMGWRIGYAAGPAALIRAMIAIQSQTTSGASSISQAAAVAALDGAQDVLLERAAILRTRRDRFAELVNGCNGLSCTPPEGTFYLLVNCAGVISKRTPDGKVIETDRDFSTYLLEEADVVVFPGEDLGLSPYIRVSFANPSSTIEEAARRLKRACEALQ